MPRALWLPNSMIFSVERRNDFVSPQASTRLDWRRISSLV
jgi:hypothetical protein